MEVYKTHDGEYPVEVIDGESHILVLKGPYEGKFYRILGFNNPEKNRITYFPSGEILLDNEPLLMKNLQAHLNKKPNLELRVVAELSLEDGKSHIIITKPIIEI